ncbi:reverse transcriptase-like protein [Sphingomonas sp. CFBP 13733]|uniref:reverse transcriptase-like protein n=1 Tax=Sphingomonas sp. CFBP 13733 TaxID=2775291 RepID=UPI0017875E3D|nr:reverse transcriptase-like protein [Sphingomonas sp. CFBP 13733]MBD8640234.1 reverse transcriptase-like protein [Sphingomonas sp. CFBP 13733]
MTTTIFFDGSFPQGTKHMHCGLVCGQDARLYHTGSNGRSSGHSEWIAAMIALEYAHENRFDDVLLIGDNRNVIGAMSCGWNVDPELLQFKHYADNISAEIGVVKWDWISTEDNPAGELLRELREAGKLRYTGIFG